jgi:hypothetical protein
VDRANPIFTLDAQDRRMADSSSSLPPATVSRPAADRNGVLKKRRTYDHGKPIAEVVRKLLGQPRATRAATVGQIGYMLLQEYQKMAVPPPHVRNLDGIAAGIADAVRGELRHLRQPSQSGVRKDSDRSH